MGVAVGVALEEKVGWSLVMKGRSQFISSSSMSIVFVDKAAILYRVSMGPVLACFSATRPQDGDVVSLHTGLVRDQSVLFCTGVFHIPDHTPSDI